MNQVSYSHHFLIIFLVTLFGLFIRLIFFSGFVLGDDSAYADFVSQIIRGSYPSIGTHGVFACRPLILYPIALCIYLFGWHEWSFVLPILIASLTNIGIVYVAGNIFNGPLAGCLAALAYALFPLDAVHATTMSNDILLSTFIWGGGLLFLVSCQRFRETPYLFVSGLSGFLVGAAVAVKFNAIVAPILFMLLGFAALVGQLKNGAYKTLGAWIAGWIIANSVLCIFLYALSGDFLAHFHAEMRFNLDYNPSGYFASTENLKNLLMLYPRWILAIGREGHAPYSFSPYGYFFLAFMFCMPLVIIKRFQKLRVPVLCALFFLLVMEFTPLKLSPAYIPIHRLPRFLHIASIPSAIAIGMAFSILFTAYRRSAKIISASAFLLLVLSSLYWSWIKADFYKDCALDQRWAWDIVEQSAAKKIIADMEMRNYLLFRSGFMPRIPIEFPNKLPGTLPPNSLIILGGARRPDMYPGYAVDWSKNFNSRNCVLISKASFPIKPWRLSELCIYQTTTGQIASKTFDDQNVKSGEKRGKSSNKSHYKSQLPGMKKIAELDVGDPDAEQKFNYQIISSTWSGSRDFPYSDGTMCEDDGRAYNGKEIINLHGLHKNRQLTILKRLDPTVINQEVKVYFNNEVIGIWLIGKEGKPFHWQESSFIIPAEHVTDTSGTLEFRFQKSDSDINSFYYWFFQPE